MNEPVERLRWSVPASETPLPKLRWLVKDEAHEGGHDKSIDLMGERDWPTCCTAAPHDEGAMGTGPTHHGGGGGGGVCFRAV